MTALVDAREVAEVRRVLLSLGYQNPSADDIALTLQQVKEARRREAEVQQQRSFSPMKQNESFRQVSASPPRGANDVTMAPDENENVEVESEEGNPRRTSTSQKQWPGLSSHSIRGGRTTPMNSTGTGRHPGRGRVAGTQPHREYCYREPYHSDGSVVVERNAQSMRRDRSGRRRMETSETFHLGVSNNAGTKETIMVPTAVGTGRFIDAGGLHYPDTGYLNPQARLGRHMRRYEKGLKAAYTSKYNDDLQDETGEESDSYDEEEESYEEGYTEFGSHEGRGRNLAMCYERRPRQPPVTPEIPLRPSRVLLNQRNANIIYSFTGDIRYKYRGGLGAPLCAVLGPNGSTLRNRSDPVRRGQQMREIWKKDKFLAQQGRKEDRWRVRQSMLSWDPS
ncbi:hypothetical protein C3747_34g402 [Trypanosoma cruzi]|uniref:Uncharacterized protein n=2 Tax=Trypanosoma cruzi TaxID=5693 RepID=Q4E0F5_TRYCC|nr:hypothetical protein, conserved [Trypanosoma cruzi]EAN98273.1 hypothetical protein, conserved [Trypanosoma cruzi]PWV14610.1 hypothetical protein C3747_34g402 [Trypanosoma cruzi]RNC47982.1 hypothetical protein TcCL_NonESM02083 [Trypanosoma cruzi]|eukprot:XP_820124.1 hypothetical protein [Trypanosoma cruzi strain CL Brener]